MKKGSRDWEKYKKYQREYQKNSQVKRRAYFREYARKNKDRRKALVLMGSVAKMMKTNKQLTRQIESDTELVKREQIKLDIKINKIKKFLNIK